MGQIWVAPPCARAWRAQAERLAAAVASVRAAGEAVGRPLGEERGPPTEAQRGAAERKLVLHRAHLVRLEAENAELRRHLAMGAAAA